MQILNLTHLGPQSEKKINPWRGCILHLSNPVRITGLMDRSFP